MLVVMIFLLNVGEGQRAAFVLGGRRSPTNPNVIAFATGDATGFMATGATFADIDSHVRSVAYSPEQDRWVACGGRLTQPRSPDATQALKWSPDGVNWTAAVTDHAEFLCKGVAWGYNPSKRMGLWVAVGFTDNAALGAILESVDGTSWQQVAATSQYLSAKWVTYSTYWDRFMLVCDGSLGAYRLSVEVNSSSWTSVVLISNVDEQFERVVASPVTGIMLATIVSTPNLYVSTNGGENWTARGVSGGKSVLGLTWANGVFYVGYGSTLGVFTVSDDANLMHDSSNNLVANLAVNNSMACQYLCASPLSGTIVASGQNFGPSALVVLRPGAIPFKEDVVAIFGSQNEGCAARSRSQIMTSLPASGETIYGNVVVNIPMIAGHLTVFGSLELSSLVLTSTAVVSVVGNTTVTGMLTIEQGAVLTTHRLVLSANSSLVVSVPSLPAAGTFVQVVVSNYTSVTGQYSTVSAIAVVSASSCGATTMATPSYTASTLTVTIASSGCDSLSTAALIGIIVGSAFGGILLALALVLAIRYFAKRDEKVRKGELIKETNESLQQELRKMKE